MTFNYMVTIKGDYNGSFVFETYADLMEWMSTNYFKYHDRYSYLTNNITNIEPLSIGTECHVLGYDDTIFTIEEFKKISEHNYVCLLSSGIYVDISKCTAIKKDDPYSYYEVTLSIKKTDSADSKSISQIIPHKDASFMDEIVSKTMLYSLTKEFDENLFQKIYWTTK